MTPVDWALGMVSILMSLALGDITLSVHRLMRNRARIRWDARVVIAAALVVQTIVRMWFLVWNIRNVEAVLNFPFYCSMFIDFMLLFLLAAACLPDGSDETDLGAFYEANRRYFWGLYLLFHAIFIAQFIYFAHGRPGSGLRSAIEASPMLLFALLCWSRNRALHIAGPLSLLIFYFWEFWGATLSVQLQ